MAKTRLNGSLKWIIGLVIAATTAGVTVGIIKGSVAENTKDITMLKTDIEKRLDKIDVKLDRILLKD